MHEIRKAFEQWFKTTYTYRMLEEMNYFKMDLLKFIDTPRNEYRHSSVQIAFITWQYRQSEIDCLKIELKCANERVALMLNHKNVMVNKKNAVIEEKDKRIKELELWNSNQANAIKSRDQHSEQIKILLQKLIDDDYTTMRPSMAYEIQNILQGES